MSRVYKQMEGRLFGPRVTHLADSLNTVNLAACSQSLLRLQQKGCKREEEKGHLYVWPVNRQILPAELYSNNMLTVPSYNCRDHTLKVMGQMQRLTLIQ